jgi:hypothetical protein
MLNSGTAMAIDYLAASEAYRPGMIKSLLVGEALLPSGKSCIYVPAALRRADAIRENRSLPVTVFHHYFRNSRPVKTKGLWICTSGKNIMELGKKKSQVLTSHKNQFMGFV